MLWSCPAGCALPLHPAQPQVTTAGNLLLPWVADSSAQGLGSCTSAADHACPSAHAAVVCRHCCILSGNAAATTCHAHSLQPCRKHAQSLHCEECPELFHCTISCDTPASQGCHRACSLPKDLSAPRSAVLHASEHWQQQVAAPPIGFISNPCKFGQALHGVCDKVCGPRVQEGILQHVLGRPQCICGQKSIIKLSCALSCNIVTHALSAPHRGVS